MCGNVLHCALYVADYKSGGSCLGIGAKQIEGEEEGKIFWVALGSVVGQEEEGGMGQGEGGGGGGGMRWEHVTVGRAGVGVGGGRVSGRIWAVYGHSSSCSKLGIF